jgi:hypothetical protein
MNTHIAKLLLGAALIGLTAGAQAETLIGWEVSTSNNWGVENLQPTLIPTEGLTTDGLVRTNITHLSGSPAGGGWGGNNISSNSVVSFTINVAEGYELALEGFDNFWVRRSGTGPSTGSLWYSVGGGADQQLATLAFTSTASGGASVLNATLQDLTNIEALQHITESITFNIRLGNASGSTGTWYIYNHTGYDLSLFGTLTQIDIPLDIPEPSTWAMLAIGASLLLLTRRRRTA